MKLDKQMDQKSFISIMIYRDNAKNHDNAIIF